MAAELFSQLEYVDVSFARKPGVEERETCASVQQFSCQLEEERGMTSQVHGC